MEREEVQRIPYLCACGKKSWFRTHYVGCRMACPRCGEYFIVPAPAVSPNLSEEEGSVTPGSGTGDAVSAEEGSENSAELEEIIRIEAEELRPARLNVEETPLPEAQIGITEFVSEFVTPSKLPKPAVPEPAPKPAPAPPRHRSKKQHAWGKGHYRVMNIIAEGGMGRVSLARDELMERTVAIKEIRKDKLRDEKSRQRFILEAKITGYLDHPGIVPVYALEYDEKGDPFYVMRKIRGETFDEAIRNYHRQKSLHTLRTILRHFIAVCQTIAYAHDVGIVHRDLKPMNLMIGEFGATFVMDWGIAKKYTKKESESGISGDEPDEESTSSSPSFIMRDAEDLTAVNARAGTKWYRSPEYIQTGRNEPSNDIYGLGIVLYKILTNKLPYESSGMGEKDALLIAEPRNPRDYLPDIPKPLAAVCMKSIQKDPKERYLKALWLADDIQRWLDNEPVTVYKYSWLEKMRLK